MRNNELEKHFHQIIDTHIQHLKDINNLYNGTEDDLMSSISEMKNIILSTLQEIIPDELRLMEITIEEYE